MKSKLLTGLSVVVGVLSLVLPFMMEKEDEKTRKKEIKDEVQKQITEFKRES